MDFWVDIYDDRSYCICMAKKQRIQDTRGKILHQGVDLLSEYGYHGTGLKMILDAAQVPKGSFYNYFESKEQFTVEVIRAYNDSLMKQFDRYVEESPQDELGTIKSMYHHVLDRSEERDCLKGCLLGDLAAEIGGQSRSCEEALRQAFQAWQNRMVLLIKKGQDSGSIRNDLSAEQLTEIFLNHWEGALLRMKVERDTANARQTLDSMLDVLFKY